MEVINMPSQSFWEEVVENSQNATFFHSPVWMRILEKTYGHFENATIGFTFNSSNRAIFPLVAEHSRGMLFKKIKHKSMPFGVYGGIVAEKRLHQEEIDTLFEYLTSISISTMKIVENPFEQYTIPHTFIEKPMFTHFVTLHSDFEQLMKCISRGRIRNIKDAQKKGVTIRLASSIEDYENYYYHYQKRQDQWGEEAGISYPWELFLNFFEFQKQGIKLWLAEKNGTIIAGIIALYYNHTILLWHGYTLQDYLDCYPSSLLHLAMLKDGCENGYKIYDLNPSVERPGVIQFKESLSAKRLDFKAYRWKKGYK
jgi:lipid II:glycine glycyltransferase (peptidoglycan interpeptide bridge formation enzyme)